ncbi:MAG: hypothetical protein ACHQTF_11170, partial [Gemmatimonadales bacterium]
PDALALDASAGSPWLLVPPETRQAFDALAAAGAPLSESVFGLPLLGVKCGCNEAFLVSLDPDAPKETEFVRVRSTRPGAPTRAGLVERHMLRPVVRGRTVGRWAVTRQPASPQPESGPTGHPIGKQYPGGAAAPEWILWTHEENGTGAVGPMAALPPGAARWLAPWRHRLAARSDTRGRAPWWALFRTDSASAKWPRVVWADIGRMSRSAVLPAGDHSVPLNSCYAVRAPDEVDAHALCAIINSTVAAGWLNVLAEPARGGFHRYLAWTVGLLPIPSDWARARAALGPVGERAAAGEMPDSDELSAMVAAAYGLPSGALAPLVSWPEG